VDGLRGLAREVGAARDIRLAYQRWLRGEEQDAAVWQAIERYCAVIDEIEQQSEEPGD